MNLIAETLLLAALLGSGIAFIIFSFYRGTRPRAVLLASLAGRWNGRVHEGSILRGDRLELHVDGVEGEVTFGEKPQGDFAPAGWTRVRFNWPSERHLRVVPEDLISRIRRLLGGSDIEFDDPAFDDRFWVQSSHPAWARGLLDREARRAIVGFHSGDGPLLDVGPSGVTLGVSRILIDHADTLGPFIELGVSILLKARGFAAPGGVVLEPVRNLPGSACPVCGHPVAGTELSCPRCRTPHHVDCWKYLGGCAIFACGRRRRTGV